MMQSRVRTSRHPAQWTAHRPRQRLEYQRPGEHRRQPRVRPPGPRPGTPRPTSSLGPYLRSRYRTGSRNLGYQPPRLICTGLSTCRGRTSVHRDGTTRVGGADVTGDLQQQGGTHVAHLRQPTLIPPRSSQDQCRRPSQVAGRPQRAGDIDHPGRPGRGGPHHGTTATTTSPDAAASHRLINIRGHLTSRHTTKRPQALIFEVTGAGRKR